MRQVHRDRRNRVGAENPVTSLAWTFAVPRRMLEAAQQDWFSDAEGGRDGW
jgi:hypothetical protein